MKEFFNHLICRRFFHLLLKKTSNFGGIKWLGVPVWQNVFDLWTIQEVISQIKPALLIECGTNRGGSAFFYANLFDLMKHGEVISVDVEKMHDISHPRIEFLLGSSVSEEILKRIRERVAAANGPILVILDSDHSAGHVAKELQAYAGFVTKGSYCLVQDGVIDVLKRFRRGRPGPLVATEEFLQTTQDFEVDHERCERFLITHHPKGWLKRVR